MSQGKETSRPPVIQSSLQLLRLLGSGRFISEHLRSPQIHRAGCSPESPRLAAATETERRAELCTGTVGRLPLSCTQAGLHSKGERLQKHTNKKRSLQS